MFAVYAFIGVVIIFVLFLHYSESHVDGGGPKTAVGLRTRLAQLLDERRGKAAVTVPAADTSTAGATLKRAVGAKEIIMARSQRRVYGLNGDDQANAEDSQLADEVMTRWCSELDDSTARVAALERLVNEFCDKVENAVKEYTANLSQYHAQLDVISEANNSLEEQLSKPVAKGPLVTANDRGKNVRPVSPVPCLVATANEEDLLSVYEQFVDELQGTHL